MKTRASSKKRLSEKELRLKELRKKLRAINARIRKLENLFSLIDNRASSLTKGIKLLQGEKRKKNP